MGDRFDGNIDYWCPEKVLTDTGKVYTVHREGIVRIIPAADMFIKFGLKEERAALVATPAGSSDILLKAGEEYFISSGKFELLSVSVNSANVVLIKQRGSVARETKVL